MCGNLRLCASVDRVARTVSFGLRCSMNREFPEEGLFLRKSTTSEEFECSEELLHWSTPLNDAAEHRRTDASRFNWQHRLDLREENLGWRFALCGNPVRILVSGAIDGLPGLVEVHQLPSTTSFYIAAHDDACVEIEKWATVACQDFQRLVIRSGLPQGWTLFTSRGLAMSAPRCEAYPMLSPPSRGRLVLRNGVRASRKNWFLPFGMPDVVLEGAQGGETVRCDSAELEQQEGVYVLGIGTPTEQKLVVEAEGNGQTIRSQPFYIVGNFPWQWSVPAVVLNKFGAPSADTAAQGIAGAMTVGLMPSRTAFSHQPCCFARRRTFFVGRVPGQIISWPAEEMPSEWEPIWAIPLERKGRAIFCGTDLASSEPLPVPERTECKKLKLWKEIVYRRQKRIGVPESPKLARLWKKFLEAASRVRG